MSQTDDLLANNETYAATFEPSGRSSAPARKVAILACMDARLDVFAALGLRERRRPRDPQCRRGGDR